MVYFSLRANDENETKQAKKVIRELKKIFGKDKVGTTNYEMWISVEIENASGWIGIKDCGYDNGNRFHVYERIDNDLQYDIPLELCDTIYCM